MTKDSKPFMSKSVMKRTRFRNKFLKNLTDENRLAYTRQRNLCVCLLRKEKMQYFANFIKPDDNTDVFLASP